MCAAIQRSLAEGVWLVSGGIDSVMTSTLTDEELTLYALCAVAVSSSQKEMKRKRSKWCKQWLLNRHKLSHTCLLKELKLEADDWYNYHWCLHILKGKIHA